MCAMCVQVQDPKEVRGIGYPGARVTDSYKLSDWVEN